MAAEGSVNFTISARDAASKVIHGVAGGLKVMAKSALIAAAGIVTSFTAATATVLHFAKSAVEAAMEDAAANVRLMTVLKARGLLTDANVEKLKLFIEASHKLAFTTAEVRSSMGTATQFAHKFNDALRIVSVAQDIARAKGMDLTTATRIVAMAYGGQGKAAKKLGVDLSKVTYQTTQKIKVDKLGHEHVTKHTKAIKGYVSGMEAVNKIDKTFVGSAKAYSNTLKGQIEAVNDSVHETKIAIGTAMLPAIGEAFRGVKPVIDDVLKTIVDKLPQLREFTRKTLQDFPNQVKLAWAQMQTKLPNVEEQIGKWIIKAEEFGKWLMGLLGSQGTLPIAIEAIAFKLGGWKGAITGAFSQAFGALNLDPLTNAVASAIAAGVAGTAVDLALTGLKNKLAAAIFGGAVAGNANKIGTAAVATVATNVATAETVVAGMSVGVLGAVVAGVMGVGAVVAAGAALTSGIQKLNMSREEKLANTKVIAGGGAFPDMNTGGFSNFGDFINFLLTGKQKQQPAFAGGISNPMQDKYSVSVKNDIKFGKDAYSKIDTALQMQYRAAAEQRANKRNK